MREKDVELGENEKIRFCHVGMQGWRDGMEDSHIAHFDVTEGVSFFGVFDGHGGAQVALIV